MPYKRRIDHWREARPATIGLATLALVAGVGLVAGEALDPAYGETAAAVVGVSAAPTFADIDRSPGPFRAIISTNEIHFFNVTASYKF